MKQRNDVPCQADPHPVGHAVLNLNPKAVA